MADAIVKVVNNRPVVKVAGSELLTPMVAAAQAARDAVRPLFGEGPPDATAGIAGSFYRDVSNPYAPLEWFKTETGWQGPQALKGDPGGTTDLIGTRQQAQTMTIGPAFAAVRTTGYAAPGDGGGALYKRVLSEPNHSAKFKSGDGQWWEVAENQIRVEQFGAVGDGLTDDAPAIQAAIDYSASIASQAYPYACRYVLFSARTYRVNTPIKQRSLVVLAGPAAGSRTAGAEIVGFGARILDDDNDRLLGAGVTNLSLRGGSQNVRIGLYGYQPTSCLFENISISNTQDQGLLAEGGTISTFSNIFVVNALIDRNRTKHVGAVDIGGADHMIDNIEGTGSQYGVVDVSSSNLFISGFLARCYSSHITRVIGQFGDIGFSVRGDSNYIAVCRGDTSHGHGAYIGGGGNVVVGLGILNPGQSPTENLYDGLFVDGSSNVVSGVVLAKTNGARGRNAVSCATFAGRNRVSVKGVSISGAVGWNNDFDQPNGAGDSAASYEPPQSGYLTHTSGSELDLSRTTTVRVFPNVPTDITSVKGAVPGCSYTLILNINARLIPGYNEIVTRDNAPIQGALLDWVCVDFVATSPTTLREIGRRQPPGVAVPNATGVNPTAEEFNALLTSLRNAGVIA